MTRTRYVRLALTDTEARALSGWIGLIITEAEELPAPQDYRALTRVDQKLTEARRKAQ